MQQRFNRRKIDLLRRLRCFGRSGPTGLLGAGNVRTHQQKAKQCTDRQCSIPIKDASHDDLRYKQQEFIRGESLLEHYSQSWPGRVHLTSLGLCTILTGRVYIDRCVTKPIRGFKVLPLSLCVPLFRHSPEKCTSTEIPPRFFLFLYISPTIL